MDFVFVLKSTIEDELKLIKERLDVQQTQQVCDSMRCAKIKVTYPLSPSLNN